MRVVHVIWNLGQGGAQTYLVQLLENLVGRPGLDLEVVVLTDLGPLSPALESLGIPYSYAGMKSGMDLSAMAKVSRDLREKKPDIVHSHTNNLLFMFLMVRLDMPVVYTEHGGGLLGGRAKDGTIKRLLRRDRWIYLFLNRPVKAFLGISDMMASLMATVNPRIAGRIRTVHNGVELSQIDAQPAHEDCDWPEGARNGIKRVGIMGRLVRQKGIELFLDTAAEIARRHDDVVFVVIGDGPLKPALEEQARALGIDEQVCFMGYQPDGVRWLKGLDVFLFTSRFEPFGLVLIEAFAARVPVVAAHIRGAVPEIVDDRVNGLVVNGADPDELARNVCELLENPQLSDEIVRNARARVESHFTMAANADAVQSVYMDIAGS